MPDRKYCQWLALLFFLTPWAIAADDRTSHLLLESSHGDIMIELNPQRAPLTVENIVTHAREGFYDGLIFHRVIEDFVIQTGGYDADFQSRSSESTVHNESGNGLSNQRGTVALARGDDPHSGSAQFYINLDDNERLDPSRARWGYAVFGRVVHGMETVETIGALPTEARGGLRSDVPEENVIIEKVEAMDRSMAFEWLDEQERGQEE
ncbi:cyclophilin family peptidyl-prolyl cis-trans isomerase [Natronospira proteinivora]|uniref:Peptidyl-prolyl cis-trans isomerase n=1 Tax=Natronospira proteinivora TaxID=1807133 RepID=A0ABT1G731_9GAMM|nr:peptidylprolyl isomerase [Natronospira proteinivora]MCP1727091.1 cyclophilin family peptidyl-prolyl cis-trans isomerase [Natronospira proteinivora]